MTDRGWQAPVPLDTDNSTEANVWRALNVAMGNGRDMRTPPPREVASDLINCNKDFEEFEVGDLIGYVENWQEGG